MVLFPRGARRASRSYSFPANQIGAIIASFAAFFLWSRGELVGVIDLREAAPRLGVELAAGDTLNFRLDVTVGTTAGYPDSSRSRTNAVHRELAASEFTVSLAQEGSAGTSTKCRAYDDKATTVSSGADDVESSGLPLECVLQAERAGLHAVTTRVTWMPKDVRAAKLEVRRQRAGKSAERPPEGPARRRVSGCRAARRAIRRRASPASAVPVATFARPAPLGTPCSGGSCLAPRGSTATRTASAPATSARRRGF